MSTRTIHDRVVDILSTLRRIENLKYNIRISSTPVDRLQEELRKAQLKAIRFHEEQEADLANELAGVQRGLASLLTDIGEKGATEEGMM